MSLKKLNERIRLSSAIASVSMIAIGVIGLERTFKVYGAIDVLLFAAYLSSALVFILLGGILGVQMIRLEHTLTEKNEAKERPSSGIEVQSKLPVCKYVHIPNSAYDRILFGDKPLDAVNAHEETDKRKFMEQFLQSDAIIMPSGKIYKTDTDIPKGDEDGERRESESI